MRTNISKTTQRKLKPALLLFVYIIHTCAFCFLNFACHASSNTYIAVKADNHHQDKKKPYSLSLAKHVAPVKLKDASEKEPAMVPTSITELPQPKHTGLCNTNPYTYCLPDDSYKRYRSLCTLLI